MSSLLKDGYICHASGHPSHPFIHGFYLYFFNTKGILVYFQIYVQIFIVSGNQDSATISVLNNTIFIFVFNQNINHRRISFRRVLYC